MSPTDDLGAALEDRLIEFAVRIMRVVDALPKTRAGRHLAGQLLECGTSGAPNYAEARSAESRNDFVHKLGVVLKELNETLVWLKMIRRAGMLKAAQVDALIDENTQLCRIIKQSIKTSRSRMRTSVIANS